MAKLKDARPGTVFGQLTVLGCCSSNKRNYALCSCTCGRVVKRVLCNLRLSTDHSCGCSQRGELIHRLPQDERGEATKLARTYRMWVAMWDRFGTAKRLSGGIPLPPESWKDFSNFKQDMGFCPSGMVLDRIDVRLPYSADNCRWATQRDSWMNKESTVYYYNGKTLVHEQHLSEIFGYATTTLKARRLKGEIPANWKVVTYDEAVAIRKANPNPEGL